MRKIAILLSLVFFITGCAMIEKTKKVETENNAAASPPAYLIISINEIHPDKMGPYFDAVKPLVQRAGGTQLLGIAQQEDIVVFDGEWDFSGILLIEKFKSMDALRGYLGSNEYQEVKKLRDGFAETNFFVAIEGKPEAN